jgi:hypothetical protein
LAAARLRAAAMGFGMVELAAWLASLPIGQALRRLNWLVPWLQIIHILANGIILSAVVMIDMRIWGISRSQTSNAATRRYQTWIWIGMILLTVTGILLILYAPRRLLTDVTFQVKMAVMGLAMVTTLALQLVLRPGWATDAPLARDAPLATDTGAVITAHAGRHALANVLATLTLVLWVGVTLAGRGRWITLLMMR